MSGPGQHARASARATRAIASKLAGVAKALESAGHDAERVAGFEHAPEVDVGDGFVLPGFIDMHNHLAYNALPLWFEPGRTQPWLHNKHWTNAGTYTASITEPAWVYAKACPEALLAYVQVRAMAGGATAVHVVKARPDRIAAVLLDLVMPGMAGSETFRALTEVRPDLPVALLSGFASGITRASALDFGFCEVVEKPVRMGVVPDLLIKLARGN